MHTRVCTSAQACVCVSGQEGPPPIAVAPKGGGDSVPGHAGCQQTRVSTSPLTPPSPPDRPTAPPPPQPLQPTPGGVGEGAPGQSIPRQGRPTCPSPHGVVRAARTVPGASPGSARAVPAGGPGAPEDAAPPPPPGAGTVCARLLPSSARPRASPGPGPRGAQGAHRPWPLGTAGRAVPRFWVPWGSHLRTGVTPGHLGSLFGEVLVGWDPLGSGARVDPEPHRPGNWGKKSLFLDEPHGATPPGKGSIDAGCCDAVWSPLHLLPPVYPKHRL